jgi:ankyrin repeat protein
MRQMFSGLTITQPSNLPSDTTSRTGSPPIIGSSPAITSDSTAHTSPHTAIMRKFEAISWEASKMLQAWGIRGSVVKSTQGHSTEYDFGFNAHLPLAWLFGSYALRGQLSIRKSSLVSNKFTPRHHSYFTVARVLEDSHPFFGACHSNDVATVRTMLSSGEGRPTDVDADGYTCLHVSRDCGIAPRLTVLIVV